MCLISVSTWQPWEPWQACLGDGCNVAGLETRSRQCQGSSLPGGCAGRDEETRSCKTRCSDSNYFFKQFIHTLILGTQGKVFFFVVSMMKYLDLADWAFSFFFLLFKGVNHDSSSVGNFMAPFELFRYWPICFILQFFLKL